VVVAILSQDATSESITGRTRGFAQEMYRLAGGANDSVAITGGYGAINTGAANPAVNIQVVVGASPGMSDMVAAAISVLTTPNLLGVFCSNEGAAEGMIAAINQGQDPGATLIVGFDAGANQKAAVRAGVFMGAITQDPFAIGYQAVSLSVAAALGQAVSDVDTGAHWWDSSNMDDPAIYQLLYD